MTIDPLAIAAAGGTVLTANKRLSRQLVRQFDQCRMTAGLRVWPSPVIFSLDAWVMRQLVQLRGEGAMLTEAQSQRLWEEIVAADAATAGRDLLQVPQAARRAREAHGLLSAYLADFTTAEADEDHLAFLRWRKSWLERLRRNQWLDRAALLPTITSAIAAGRCDVPPTVVLAGFDDLTPAVQRLCSVLAERGCRIEHWQAPEAAAAEAASFAAIDMADEVRCCARWARLHLERSPEIRVGVVVPQLADYQELIERIFRAELDPPACLTGIDGAETFTLSLGTPLSGEGVIRAALRLLAAGDTLSLDEIGWLLRSPYLGGGQSEGAERARADRTLRQRGRSEWRLAGLARALSHLPRMVKILERLQVAGRDKRRGPGEWAEAFANLLDSCGWPGERGLSSREFQAIGHFKEALGQLASLDRVSQPTARGEALAILNRLVTETIFQPEGGEGRIQVLGMLEAAGFAFDALWVLGLHERAFPSPPRPNPFLPLSLQSRLRMPHADATREGEFAQGLARRLFVAAPVVVASWPGQVDGAPLRPSPLIRSLPAVRPALAPSCDPFLAVLQAPCELEQFVDDKAVSLPADRPFSGGTGILTDQALCPFRAFAHHRLHARKLDEPDLGLDNLARGSLVHGVLERFWRQVGTLAALLALDPLRQAALLDSATQETLQQFERRSRCDLPPRLRALESRRLAAIASGWLALERRREPFRVAEIEQWHDAAAGKLKLRTRIDRIDELADGQLAVIDYKTGRPNPRQWFDERVTEPQLPLYCLDLETARIGAVLFAAISNRESECAFKGVARDPEAWPNMGVKTQHQLLADHGWSSFDEIVAHWRTALPALGDAFVEGQAVVDPVDAQKACAYCDLMTLCRIGDRGGLDAGVNEGEADE